MSYKTKKIKYLSLNYRNKEEPICHDGVFKLPKDDLIEDITIVLKDGNQLINEINDYLIYRYFFNNNKSNLEARGLRVYFNFLKSINKSWSDGAEEASSRPVYLFFQFLRKKFKDCLISGGVAVSYFNVVIRFYKYHLETGQEFKMPPVSFKRREIKTNEKKLTKYVFQYSVEININDYKPKIPTSYKKHNKNVKIKK